MLSVVYIECHKQTHYAECRYAECRYAECRSADKRSSLFGLCVGDGETTFYDDDDDDDRPQVLGDAVPDPEAIPGEVKRLLFDRNSL